MRKQDIEVGETYLFVATDNPTRKHLEGQPFKVVERKAVFRKLKRGTRKPIRFFNENGVGARAEELGPLPPGEWVKCNECDEVANISTLQKIKEDNDDIAIVCPNCNAGPEYLIDYPVLPLPIENPGVLAQPGADEPEWPCVECGEGGMQPDGFVSPQGQQTYKCDHCGHTLTYP